VSRRADIVTAVVAIAIHAVAALALARQDTRPSTPRRSPVEVEFRRPLPPPAIRPVATAARPPALSRPAPRPAPRKVAIRTPTPLAPAPPATPDAPVRREPAPPVYGVAMESPTDAGSAVAAARGGSGLGVTAGGSRRAGGVPGPIGRATELDIGKMPEVDAEACGRSIHYPPEAEQAGVEGKVRLRLALDARGQVISARVLRGIGHGLDQAAVEALTHRCRFTPAIGGDGRPVPFVIESYSFTFELPR
jgi:protein TonB